MASTVEMRAILRDEITAGLKGIEAELKKVQAEGAGAGKAIGSMAPASQSATKSFDLLASATKAFVGIQLVGYVKDATVAIFNATKEMDSLKRGMIAVMGSSANAADEMERLKEVAKLPGLGYQEAIRMSTNLQASGMSAKMARDAMMSFGNALATVGKGKAELDGVGIALTQIMSKGKVSAEEINQIAERVPQIRKAMEAAFGTANTEVIQAMGLSSREFISGVTAELGKLEKVTGGLGNESENLSDAWFQLKANIGGAGTVFSDSLRLINSVLGSVNKGYDEMRKASEKAKIDTALKTMAWIRKVEAEEIASGRKLTVAEKAEIEKRLNQQRKILSEFAPKLTKPEVDARMELAKSLESVRKKTAADEIKMEEIVYKRRVEIAGNDSALLEKVEEAHQQRLDEIRKKYAPKKKKSESEDLGWNDPKRVDSAKSYAEKIMADEAKRRERSAKEFQEARDADAKEEEKANKEHQKRVDEWNDAELKKADRWREFELEREAMRDKEREEFEQSMAARLGMHNATITSMLKGETEFNDGIRTMWDETGTAIINKLLEVATTWMAQQIAMLVFGTGVKAAEVGTSVAAGAAMTAAYAPAAASASIASFGGAAAAGSASMAATVPAMMAMFSYADRGSSTLVGHNRMIVGESRPEEFRRTVPGNIHNTTTNYGAVNVTVQGGGDAKAIAREIVRAQRTAGANNYGGSH